MAHTHRETTVSVGEETLQQEMEIVMNTMCRACKKLWCDSECKTPVCKSSCLEKVDFHGLKLSFCGVCQKEMLDSFEKQFPKKPLPFKRLRYEKEMPDD